MKLAEALAKRADMVKQSAVLQARIRQNAVSKEGQTPAEDVNELIKEAFILEDELCELIQRINSTNAVVKFDDDMTLINALSKRDSFQAKRMVLLAAITRASEPQDRYSQTELIDVRHVDVAKLQKEADRLAKEHRILDLKIQEKNWTTELI